MATNSIQSASSPGATPTQAKKRLEDALARLEAALDEKEQELAAAKGLQASLDAATREVTELKDKNATIASRLDGAIERMKSVLGDA